MIEVIKKYAGLPFRYGQDCCQFAGECVEAITGKNPMLGFLYDDEKSAYDIIHSYGDLEGAALSLLGDPYTGHKDGDVCLLEIKGRQLIGIIFNGRAVVRTEQTGLMDLPINRAKLIWCT